MCLFCTAQAKDTNNPSTQWPPLTKPDPRRRPPRPPPAPRHAPEHGINNRRSQIQSAGWPNNLGGEAVYPVQKQAASNGPCSNRDASVRRGNSQAVSLITAASHEVE